MGFLDSLFGGPSPQEEQQQAQMSQQSKNLAYDSGVTFQNDQAMYKSVLSSIMPSLASDGSQFGMSTAEEASERSMLAEQLSSAEAGESQMLNESLASRGVTPGAGISPAALASIEGALAQKYNVAKAMGNLEITKEGYAIGREKWKESLQTALGLQRTEAGLSSEEAATGVKAGAESFDEAKTINSQKNGLMKGLLAVGGDIAGSFIGDPNLGNQFVSAAYNQPSPSGPIGAGLKNPFSSGGGGFNMGTEIGNESQLGTAIPGNYGESYGGLGAGAPDMLGSGPGAAPDLGFLSGNTP